MNLDFFRKYQLTFKNIILLFLRTFPTFYIIYAKKFSSWSLNDLDLKLAQYLPATGTFLEAGANDGILQSNSFLLEFNYGWTGICVEPIPRLFKTLQKTRINCINLNVALSGTNNEVSTVIYDNDLMSGKHDISDDDLPFTNYRRYPQRIECKVQTLSSILSNSNFSSLDLLVLDVEGGESDILTDLMNFDFEISFILLETKYLDNCERILKNRYNLQSKLTHHDYLFKLLS